MLSIGHLGTFWLAAVGLGGAVFRFPVALGVVGRFVVVVLAVFRFEVAALRIIDLSTAGIGIVFVGISRVVVERFGVGSSATLVHAI